MRKPYASKTNLGAIRVAAGLSQADVAKMVGCHQTLVSFWERGACSPKDAQVAQMAAMFSVTEESVRKAVRADMMAYPSRLAEFRQRRAS